MAVHEITEHPDGSAEEYHEFATGELEMALRGWVKGGMLLAGWLTSTTSESDV